MLISMRRTDIALLCMVLAWPLSVSASAFWDVPDEHRYADAVNYVSHMNIVQGYPDGSFQPDILVNRAEFVKILMRYQYGADGVQLLQCTTQWPYTDVPSDVWYIRYLCRATDDGVIDGYEDSTFRPDHPINFAEAAKIMSIVDVATGKGGSLGLNEEGKPWYQRYIDHLALRRAVPLSIRSVDQLITRGEMVEMLYRFDLTPESTMRDLETLGRVSWREIVDECADKPIPASDGSMQYPIRTEFKHLGYLGELLTAEECTEKRLAEVSGGGKTARSGQFPSLKLAAQPTPIFRRYLEQAGFSCQMNVEADACREWGNFNTVSIGTLLGLRPYAHVIASFSCPNCTEKR